MREIKFRAFCQSCNKYVNADYQHRINGGLTATCPYHNIYTECLIDQYAGLKDKNGKEDYIDDIVKVVVGGIEYYRKVYQAPSGAFCIDLPIMGSTTDGGVQIYSIVHENVGNIHENPDLIK